MYIDCFYIYTYFLYIFIHINDITILYTQLKPVFNFFASIINIFLLQLELLM